MYVVVVVVAAVADVADVADVDFEIFFGANLSFWTPIVWPINGSNTMK